MNPTQESSNSRMEDECNQHSMSGLERVNSMGSLPNLPFAEPHPEQSGLKNCNASKCFQQICDLEKYTKSMIETFCSIIDGVAKEQKLIPEDHIEARVAELNSKYEGLMGILEVLPIYDGTIEDYEKQVLNKHSQAVGNFRGALNSAMIWKKELHAVINAQIMRRN